MSTNPQFVGTPSQVERLQNEADLFKTWGRNISANLRVAWPGIVVSFDENAQTVEVDLALQDRLYTVISGQTTPTWQYLQIPRLVDVPIALPRAGGFTLTMPVSKGDECLIILNDVCINAWWQNGAIAHQDGYIGQQWERPRRHSFSDGIAIIGVWSQPRKLTNYSTDSAQLRSDDGSVVIDLADNGITMTAPKITINSNGDVDISAQGNVNIIGNTGASLSGNNQAKVDGKTFLIHSHTGGTIDGDTGPVV